MRIGLYCENDWANAMYNTAKALEAVGATVKATKAQIHEWYPEEEQVAVGPPPTEVDILVLFNTHPGELRHAPGCPVVVRHGGSAYRQNKEHWLKFWDKRADGTLFATEDLLYDYANPYSPSEHELVKRTPDMPWVLWHNPVHVPSVTHYSPRMMPKVVHVPSNQRVKGTKNIIEAMQELLHKGCYFQFSYQSTPVPHERALQLFHDADLVIDCVNHEQRSYDGGFYPFGEFGNQTKECAARMRPVITNHRFAGGEYRSRYGYPGVAIANNIEMLKQHVERLVSDPPKLLELARMGRGWVTEQHSPQKAAIDLKAFLADVLEGDG